ncbi:hypothetical protein CYMTET_14560 [Cymbomonas tetramitiformis]|uniref:DDE-1 domain-containing protein n=1 Tax=Cymbomonas tetramitiformis TaxID=36881 RepID=A0AAE0L319_9CHLO|nr:hypothetical protein CYMTET_21578 [Cymbomonas tetramitiformis]KAK3277425.1 hypothetical protein CYMTET_14560 [Cymbomonas tetramitiformis]
MIANTEVEKKFIHGVVSDKWYYGFLDRWNMRTKNQRPFETDRVKWCTAKNLHQHYKVLAHTLVDAGIAVWNPDFEEDTPQSEMIHIIKPERLLSFDESRLTMDQTSTSKAKAERIVTVDKDDVGDVVANKGGGDGTLCASTIANGHAGPPLWIFAAESFKLSWVVDAPRSTVIDPSTGRGYPSTFTANTKGGMTFDLGVHFMRTNVAVMYPDLSRDNPVVVICDGHGSHLTLELLDYCREVGITVVLRPPHTSNISQGEDVRNFAIFKPAFRVSKAIALTRKLDTIGDEVPSLGMADMLPCAYEPYQKAFHPEHNKKAWSLIGVYPFTRCVYWTLVEAEKKKVAVVAAAPGVNHEVLSFGFRRLQSHAHGEDGEEGEGAEDQEADEVLEGRVTSRELWARGPATSDKSAGIVRAKTMKKKQKEEDKDKRKRVTAEVTAERLLKYARVAEEAKAKWMAVNNKVVHAKLLKDELVASLRVRGSAPAASALKAQLEADLQALLGPPQPTGPCGMFF